MKKLLVATTFTAASLMAMHDAEININNTDLMAKVNFDMGQFQKNLPVETIFVGAGITNGSNENANYNGVNTKIDLMAKVKGNIKTIKNLSFAGGIKMVYTKADMVSQSDLDFIALPLTAEVEYKLPEELNLPITFGVYGAVSPKVLSLADAENYFETNTYAKLEIVRNIDLKAGYRYIETDYNQGNVVYNQSAYAGIDFKF